MHLFVNDIPVTILRPGSKPDAGNINHQLDADIDKITRANLINNVWVEHVEIEHLEVILDLINSNVPLTLISLYVTVRDYKQTKAFLRGKFKVVDAAGGLVVRKDRYLMMLRMKKWDLPKGKREGRESSRQTAEREVQEECNITVKVVRRLVTTWHTYTMNRNNMLKRTRWYVMEALDDSKMRPETGEDIEELRWMTKKEVYHALSNSYKSIQFVFSAFYEMEDELREKLKRKPKSKA